MKTILMAVVLGAVACGGSQATVGGDKAQASGLDVTGNYTLTVSSPINVSATAFSGQMLIVQSGTKLSGLASIANPNLPDPSFSQAVLGLDGSMAADGTLTLTSEKFSLTGKAAADGTLSGTGTGLYLGAAWTAAPR